MQETAHEALTQYIEPLALDESVINSATTIYDRAIDNNLHRGRDRAVLRAGAVYTACRIHKEPHNATDVARVSELERSTVLRGSRALNSALDLPIPPQDPRPYVHRYVDDLDLTDTTKDYALALLDASDVGTGTAAGLAASAVYAATTRTNDDVTQATLSDEAGVSTVTIRNWYRDLLDAYDTEEAT